METEERTEEKIEESNLELQEKKVYEKIDPILQLYDEGNITRIEFVEKLAEAFYSLEDEIIIHKMRKPDDAIKLHETLEGIFG